MPKITSLLVILLLFTVACVSNSNEDCATTNGVTFSTSGGQIQNIITKYSGSTCHSSGGSGTVIWTIGNYNLLKPFFQIMSETVANGTMPEAGSSPMTTDELIKFECWSQSGYPGMKPIRPFQKFLCFF